MKILVPLKEQKWLHSSSANGKIEHWDRYLHSMIAKLIDANHRKWVDFLAAATMSCTEIPLAFHSKT